MINPLEEAIFDLTENTKSRGVYYLDRRDQFRALMNICQNPELLSDTYYRNQDAVLQEELSEKDIVDVEALPFAAPKICLYRGDITCLKAEAIVNACNEYLLGCFQPLHTCIDNCIHSAAGLQVRRDLKLELKGATEPNGCCRVTKGYNLPAKYIFHTVGPIAAYGVDAAAEEDLANCYRSCLAKAEEMGLHSIVFCSISTGVYGYPILGASSIAVREVKTYLDSHPNSSIGRVVFDLWSEKDFYVYQSRLEKANR